MSGSDSDPDGLNEAISLASISIPINQIEARLEEKEKEPMLLRKRDTDSADKITRLEENMNTLLQTLVSKGVLEPTKTKTEYNSP